jgi:hypothetical protein
MANSMKSADVIQEVKILSRVTASHRPGSGTRWQEETNVRSRGKQVGRPCIEPRNGYYVVVQNARPWTGKGINTQRTPESGRCEPGTVSTRWNPTSEATPPASRQGGHRGRRPEHADQGMTRELVRASSFPVARNRGSFAGRSSAGVHRETKAPTRKGLHRKADPVLKCGEHRYDATSRRAKERRMDVRQS